MERFLSATTLPPSFRFSSSTFFLLLIGYFIDQPFFQLPAGASITLLFAVLIGVTGAVVYFFQSWSVPVLILFIFALNLLYRSDWIDPRNKAYGLNYGNKSDYPAYTQPVLDSITTSPAATADKRAMGNHFGPVEGKTG